MPEIIAALIKYLLGLVGSGVSNTEQAKIDEQNKKLNDALDKATRTSDTSDLDSLTK